MFYWNQAAGCWYHQGQRNYLGLQLFVENLTLITSVMGIRCLASQDGLVWPARSSSCLSKADEKPERNGAECCCLYQRANTTPDFRRFHMFHLSNQVPLDNEWMPAHLFCVSAYYIMELSHLFCLLWWCQEPMVHVTAGVCWIKISLVLTSHQSVFWWY